jgi:ABC-2 type transport system permease protein
MISTTIFKQTLKENLKLWLIFTIILCSLNAVLIAVFDPSTINGMSEMVKGTPLENMLAQTTFLGMLAQTFYSLHGVLLPLIYIMMTANSLIASKVDRGSMAYLLSTPTRRSTVVFTQAIYLVSAIVVMFIILTGIGVASVHIFQGDIDYSTKDYVLLNVGLFLLMFAISSISFLFSCLFNLSKNSLALGAGIPLAFFLFHLISQVDSSLEALKYVSLNALFDTTAILNGEGYVLQFIILAAIGVALYITSIRIFKYKDLPL